MKNWKKANMGEVKKRIKIFVGEADAVYIFRERVEIKALKIAKTLI